VFVSCTFRDMHAEREELVKQVFPQLRKLCEERGVGWTEVDLRWDVTEEQAQRGEVLPICLAEIDRCRPYFIGLLGERYGRVHHWFTDEAASTWTAVGSLAWARQASRSESSGRHRSGSGGVGGPIIRRLKLGWRLEPFGSAFRPRGQPAQVGFEDIGRVGWVPGGRLNRRRPILPHASGDVPGTPTTALAPPGTPWSRTSGRLLSQRPRRPERERQAHPMERLDEAHVTISRQGSVRRMRRQVAWTARPV